MKDEKYGEGYEYSHEYEGGFSGMDCLPDKLKDRIYYKPKDIGQEKAIKERLEGWWKKRRMKDKL